MSAMLNEIRHTGQLFLRFCFITCISIQAMAMQLISTIPSDCKITAVEKQQPSEIEKAVSAWLYDYRIYNDNVVELTMNEPCEAHDIEVVLQIPEIIKSTADNEIPGVHFYAVSDEDGDYMIALKSMADMKENTISFELPFWAFQNEVNHAPVAVLKLAALKYSQ